ncbi:PhzF family phenazine biosynthesis protein [Williamsia deligens]|uniref:PhzF family phenazine biosynthesis protein n=1 Tax=Williamsia deligens TaxID=321325 RepID=A0ABW3G9G9_9NOCA|nr:PhzF family phenazine biosynthesis protein [Williamsia deligens]MCP2192487.1 phenazine biosynthesis protein PhzF family [Williamsia deligens]
MSTPSSRPFAQVDVFVSGPLTGNPVAVVLDGDGLDDATMAAFARWTNLSETTFVLPPTDSSADYRLRIFTPGGELPFAGHPTLGSAHAWLEAGGVPAAEAIVQECGIGLVTIRRDGARLAFAAPPLRRSGPVDDDVLAEIRSALGLAPSDVVASNWVDNGPGWIGLMLTSAERVLEITPDFGALGDHKVGLIGAHRGDAADAAYEVRAFVPGVGVPEDPVTGSLNAGFAVWLRSAGEVPASYVAAQGTAIGRAGRVSIDDDGDSIWVGGVSNTTITGTVTL